MFSLNIARAYVHVVSMDMLAVCVCVCLHVKIFATPLIYWLKFSCQETSWLCNSIEMHICMIHTSLYVHIVTVPIKHGN